jgi:hypothetical protein
MNATQRVNSRFVEYLEMLIIQLEKDIEDNRNLIELIERSLDIDTKSVSGLKAMGIDLTTLKLSIAKDLTNRKQLLSFHQRLLDALTSLKSSIISQIKDLESVHETENFVLLGLLQAYAMSPRKNKGGE